MKLIMLMIMILLSIFADQNYSQIKSIEENYIAVPKDTFKIIIEKLIERNSYKEQLQLIRMDNDLLLQENKEYSQKIVLYEKNKDELLKYLDQIKPTWYDKFYVGFGVSTVLFGMLLILK